MSIKEQIAEAKSQLAALKERIEANDAEAIAEGEKLAQTIETKTAELAAAEKKAAVLKALGSTDTDKEDTNMEEKNTKTFGEQLKELNLAELKTSRGGRSIMLPRKAATDVVVGSQIPSISQYIPEVPAIRVRDVFGAEQISGNALTYFVMGATEGSAAVTAENAKKPQIHPTYTKVTTALSKVAAFLKETDEILEDIPYLESVIRGRGVKAVRDVIDATLVTNLLATSGINTTVNTGISFDNLLKAKMAIAAATGFTPDTIIINPADLQTLLLQKDATNGQYLIGGPAYAPYGNGNYSPYLPIWGMQVIGLAAITSGTAIVGACKDGAAVVTKAGEGMRAEVTNSDSDDFEYNRVCVRMEERILLAVRVPGAFAKVYTA